MIEFATKPALGEMVEGIVRRNQFETLIPEQNFGNDVKLPKCVWYDGGREYAWNRGYRLKVGEFYTFGIRDEKPIGLAVIKDIQERPDGDWGVTVRVIELERKRLV